MRHSVIAIAAAGIAVGAAACSSSGTHHGAQGHAPSDQPSGGGRGVTGGWAIVSCQVDVTYLDDVNTVDYYVPDTGANFRHYFADSNVSGNANLAVVVMLVNHTGSAASLPTGLVVSFTDQSGSHVGSPQTFNKANGTGYGAAVAGGRGSGEVFSSGTQFSPGQAVSESPDIGASVPHKPGLNCQVSRPAGGPSSS